jgi:hypothetical protein
MQNRRVWIEEKLKCSNKKNLCLRTFIKQFMGIKIDIGLFDPLTGKPKVILKLKRF